MNNLAIDFSKLSSDSTAMDELREKYYAKEQNMEAVKFREFHFSIPANETTLIDMAELIEKKANVFKNKVAANENKYASDEECDKAIEAVMQGLKQPKSKAVFERLKNK